MSGILSWLDDNPAPVVPAKSSAVDDIFGIQPEQPTLSDLYDAVRRAEHRCKVDLSEVRALIQKAEDSRLMSQDWHQFEHPILDEIRKAMKPEPTLTGFALERKARKIFVDEPKQSEDLQEVFA